MPDGFHVQAVDFYLFTQNLRQNVYKSGVYGKNRLSLVVLTFYKDGIIFVN
jgi:hypothetical protein